MKNVQYDPNLHKVTYDANSNLLWLTLARWIMLMLASWLTLARLWVRVRVKVRSYGRLKGFTVRVRGRIS